MRSPQPRTILLVEDNPADQEIVRRSVKKMEPGIDLHVVHDGEQAIDYLFHRGDYGDSIKNPTPAIVLLDLNLPRRSGKDVLREVRRNATLKHMPIIVLTTSRNEDDIRESYELGCNCFLIKPSPFHDCVDMVRSTCHYWLDVATLPNLPIVN